VKLTLRPFWVPFEVDQYIYTSHLLFNTSYFLSVCFMCKLTKNTKKEHIV